MAVIERKMSDAELQRLLANTLRTQLVLAGMTPGAPSHVHCAVALPVNLDLAGEVEVERDEDGIWTFRQTIDSALDERTAATEGMHAAAIMTRGVRPCR